MKTHVRVVTAFVLLVVTVGLLAAEESSADGSQGSASEAPYTAYPQALGVAFGPITATGLHYHAWAGDLGYQATAGIIYLPAGETYGNNILNYEIGGGIQRRVYGDAFADWLAGSLYLFAGGNHRGFIPSVATDPTSPETDPSYTAGSFHAQVTVGAGIGIEVILFQHFSIPAEFGYGGSWVVTEPDVSQAIVVQLYAQTALRYRY